MFREVIDAELCRQIDAESSIYRDRSAALRAVAQLIHFLYFSRFLFFPGLLGSAYFFFWCCPPDLKHLIFPSTCILGPYTICYLPNPNTQDVRD